MGTKNTNACLVDSYITFLARSLTHKVYFASQFSRFSNVFVGKSPNSGLGPKKGLGEFV